jgi:CRISPR system Cascade subunit CasD
MQSWGVQSQFSIRDTGMEPTKSGVVGLVCAALGRPREAPIDELRALRMGVRVDREGQKRRDYHTAGKGGFLRARGAVEKTDVVPSERYYLADAHFTVGLEGSDLDLLTEVHEALAAPHWPLSLGRKAFPPGLPVYLTEGLRPKTRLLDALDAHEWRYQESRREKRPDNLPRYVIERWDESTDLGEPDVQRIQPDQPLSFQPRRFAMREIAVFRRQPEGWSGDNSSAAS